jgi:O-antigen ligase
VDWILYLIAFAPAVMLPMVTYDIFCLPQTAFLALLSAVGLVGLGVGGAATINLPILLSIFFLIYIGMNNLWTATLEGARREFGIQFVFIASFIIASAVSKGFVTSGLMALFIVGSLIQVYAVSQTFGYDILFLMRMKLFPGDRRPIGTIGNMNFFSAYILPLFWVGVYLGVTVPGFIGYAVISSCITLYLLRKTQCRGAIIGLIVSTFFLFVLLSIGGFTQIGWAYGAMAFGLMIAFAILGWLWDEWDAINGEIIREEHREDIGGKIITYAPTTKYATLRYRIAYWQSGWELFKEKPWQGHGLRSYRKLVYYAQAAINDRDPNYLNPERYYTPQPRECHNDWLEDLVELGIVGSIIRWALIGSVFWVGFSIIKGNLAAVFILTAMLAMCVHAVFFFSLRVPGSGLVFWVLAGLLVAMGGVPLGTITFSPWLVVPMLLALTALYWETIIKPLMSSYYYMRFQISSDVREKEMSCHKANHWQPDETIVNTHMLIGYMNIEPHYAYKFAEQMWAKYDGMTPGWVMHCNMGVISELVGNYELAARHYATSLRLLPTFPLSIEGYQRVEKFVPLPRKGDIVKQVKEEARLHVLLLQERINNLELTKQNIAIQMQNVVLQEANRLNIPMGWQYVAEKGLFLSPEEFELYKREQQHLAAQQQAGATSPPTPEEGQELSNLEKQQRADQEQQKMGLAPGQKRHPTFPHLAADS